MSSNGDVSTLLHRLGGVYRDPTRVSRDSSRLLRSSVGTNLVPSVGSLIQNTGEEVPRVLMFSGTIGMSYKGSTYNVPVDVYLPPPYPVRPPVCFVRPTSDMLIKENHRHVANDGMVFMPYLHEWRPHTHNLVEMVVMMSSLFGSSPPVFARPAGAPIPASRPPSYTDVARRQMAGGYAAAASSRAEEAERVEAERVAREAIQKEIDDANEAASAARRAEEEERRGEEERRRLEAYERKTAEETRRMLTACIQSALGQNFADARGEIQSDLRDQAKLQRSGERIELSISELRERKEALARAAESVDDAAARITSFLSTVESSDADEDEADVDDLAGPSDALSSQMLRLAAENQAISDALYFLDRGLMHGTVGLERHMKSVRRLAKRQFLVRAHLMKVAQVRASDRKSAC